MVRERSMSKPCGVPDPLYFLAFSLSFFIFFSIRTCNRRGSDGADHLIAGNAPGLPTIGVITTKGKKPHSSCVAVAVGK